MRTVRNLVIQRSGTPHGHSRGEDGGQILTLLVLGARGDAPSSIIHVHYAFV